VPLGGVATAVAEVGLSVGEADAVDGVDVAIVDAGSVEATELIAKDPFEVADWEGAIRFVHAEIAIAAITMVAIKISPVRYCLALGTRTTYATDSVFASRKPTALVCERHGLVLTMR
jgi:hypothetical protein